MGPLMASLTDDFSELGYEIQTRPNIDDWLCASRIRMGVAFFFSGKSLISWSNAIETD